MKIEKSPFTLLKLAFMVLAFSMPSLSARACPGIDGRTLLVRWGIDNAPKSNNHIFLRKMEEYLEWIRETAEDCGEELEENSEQLRDELEALKHDVAIYKEATQIKQAIQRAMQSRNIQSFDQLTMRLGYLQGSLSDTTSVRYRMSEIKKQQRALDRVRSSLRELGQLDFSVNRLLGNISKMEWNLAELDRENQRYIDRTLNDLQDEPILRGFD